MLGQSYWRHHTRVLNEMQPKIMGYVSIDVLEGIEVFANGNPGSPVAQMQKQMLAAIGPDATAGDPQTVSRFSDLYRSASDIVFPATCAFLTACHAVNEVASSHSLSAIDLATLRAIDLEAHRNSVLDTFRIELKSRLNKVKGVDDVTAFSQAFEIYGEIIAYLHLREHVPTERRPERKGRKTPDFKCSLPNGKIFFVEVKSLDVVDGEPKNLAMLDDGMDANAELEEQVHAGKSVASATTVIAPYRKAGETNTYDPRSLIRVINTLREKSLQVFKAGQFADGSTFALAITDRLVLSGGKFALAPYYYSDVPDGGIASGVLWHAAYGHPGTPIFRLPESAGAKSLEGYLDRFGLFADCEQPFYGPGLIVLDRGQCGHDAFGLVNDCYPECGGWSVDDTEEVVDKLCDRWNDRDARRSWDISADIVERRLDCTCPSRSD